MSIQSLVAASEQQNTGMLDRAVLVESARSYAASSKSQATRRAYQSDWSQFEAWCASHGLQSLPAEPSTVAVYVAALADQGRRASSIERALSAIVQAHKVAGFESPRSSVAVRNVMQGIKRTHGTSRTQKAPVLVGDLRRMVATLPEGNKGVRDRALLLLGFAGALRRSELVSLDVADLAFDRDGLTVTIRRSKTDQEAQGCKVGIPYGSDPATCPVRATQAWLAASGIVLGAVFRSVNRHGQVGSRRLAARDVARTVKTVAKAAGLDASQYSGHSLRAGLATSAAQAGRSERSIMAQGRWRSVAIVRGYVRHSSLFVENAASGIGL